MYSFESRIRYSELDATEKLSIPGLVNYFQDCSTFQSDDLGVGLDYMHEKNLVWVVSAWQIEVARFPKLSEYVTIGTLPYEIKGFIGLRNFFMKDSEGNYLAKANSYWTLLSMENMRPVRADEKMLDRYKLEPKIDMNYLPRRIEIPKDNLEDVKLEHFYIQNYHMDGNGHVNNAQYVNLSTPFLKRKDDICQLRVEYKTQAHTGEEVVPRRIELENSEIVILENAEGKPYTICEFMYR